MSDRAPAMRALEALERLHNDLLIVAQRTDDARRGELVRLRCLLSEQIGVVGEAAEPLFADSPDHAEFRRLYSAMRTATAMHQADWPAVRLGEFDDDYRASGARVRVASQTFTTWLREWLQRRSQSPSSRT